MPYDLFWNGDCTLVKAYHKAFQIKFQVYNQQAWLQGRYIYEALLDVSPVMHAFAKKGSKPIDYPKEPYKLRDEEEEPVDKGKELQERITKRMEEINVRVKNRKLQEALNDGKHR